jgi:hypothetical protein
VGIIFSKTNIENHAISTAAGNARIRVAHQATAAIAAVCATYWIIARPLGVHLCITLAACGRNVHDAGATAAAGAAKGGFPAAAGARVARVPDVLPLLPVPAQGARAAAAMGPSTRGSSSNTSATAAEGAAAAAALALDVRRLEVYSGSGRGSAHSRNCLDYDNSAATTDFVRLWLVVLRCRLTHASGRFACPPSEWSSQDPAALVDRREGASRASAGY